MIQILIVYSYNRPLQLYAFLESAKKYVSGLNKLFIVYRSDFEYEFAYLSVINDFLNYIFIKQSANPRGDFKKITLNLLNKSESNYIVFAVDDIIIKDYIDFISDAKIMEKTGAYGFFYRLGTYVDHGYHNYHGIPPLTKVDDVFSWNFNEGKGDWNYPHCLDMTLYKKSDVIKMITELHFFAPNNFEGNWAGCSPAKQLGLCHFDSKIVNIPLNLVQDLWVNPHMNAYSAKELLEFFNNGLKIDINTLFKIKNNAAHWDYMPTFIKQ